MQYSLPGFGGRGGLVVIGGRGVCGGNGGFGPSPPFPIIRGKCKLLYLLRKIFQVLLK